MIAAALKCSGKTPWENDRLASVAIRSVNTAGHALMRAVGMKSIEHVFGGIKERSLPTSRGVTSGMVLKGDPMCAGSR